MSSQKRFAIPGEQIRQLVPAMGGCFASDRVTVDGAKVGYMYRETPEGAWDSGWRFFAGDESQEYADDSTHFAIYDVNTVANYDPDVIPYLSTPTPCAFEKSRGSSGYSRVD